MILKLKRTPGIYLVGFMGSGKSTVGRALADELGWFFLDLDEEIERQQAATISGIFDAHGETAFRRIESDALQKIVRAIQSGRPHVVSLGGGAFLSEENFDLVSNHGISLWLDSPLQTIERRIASEAHRPLARDPQQLRSLFEARRPGYSRADYRIDHPGDDPADAVAQILKLPLFTP
jgi:shikimate kinase